MEITYNNKEEYGPQLKKRIANFDKPVKYKMLGIKKRPYNDPSDPGKTFIYDGPSVALIPPMDEIVDPDTNKIHYIGILKGNNVKNPSFNYGLTFERTRYWELDLSPRKAGDRKIFEFFELSNYNASNPHRDPSIRPIWERVDEDTASKKRLDRGELKADALKLFFEMTDQEVVKYAANRGGEYFDPDENPTEFKKLKAKLLEEIEENPEVFRDTNSDHLKELKYTITESERLGLIEHDEEQSLWKWASTGSEIIPHARGVGKHKALVDFIHNKGDQGNKLEKELTRLVNKTKEDRKKERESKKKATVEE